MTGNKYQKYAMRTNDGKSTDRLIYLASIMNRHGVEDYGGLINGCLGLAGESGEVLDLVKKSTFHEKELDIEHFKKEIGDVMWYVAMICESAGFSLDDVMQTNVDKLMARYPDGFDTYRANHRQKGDI